MSTLACKSREARRPAEVSASPARDPALAAAAVEPAAAVARVAHAGPSGAAREIGGVAGPEPTRFGDWEKNGRCIDF